MTVDSGSYEACPTRRRRTKAEIARVRQAIHDVASAFFHSEPGTTSDMTHRIYIEPTTIRGGRGQNYRVDYQGSVLIDEAWNPELEACRALLARGIVGRLEAWRFGKDHPDMLIADIAKAAEWTVEENEKSGPRLVRWRPRPEHLPQNAVSSSAPFAPAAVFGPGDHPPPRIETESAE